MSNVNNGTRGSGGTGGTSAGRGDVQLERLLRGSLRAAPAPAPTDACLDAETLAAWADDALPSDARGAAEAHAAGCARCQALLAAMARTQPAAAVSEPWWRRRMLGWLIPLTAAATAGVIWVAVSPGLLRAPAQTARATAAPAVRKAEAPSIDQATPSPNANEPLGRLYQDEFKKTDQKARPEPGGAGSAEERNKLKESAPRAKISEQAANAREQSASTRADGDKGAFAAPPPAPAAPVAGVAPPPTAARAQAPASSSPTVAPVPSVQSGAASMNDARMAQAGRRFDVGSIEIASPDSSSRWRVNIAAGIGATFGARTTDATRTVDAAASASVVQHSTDGGATWTNQSTGVSAQLAAGASPSASVCWLVGRGGMVLLSIDGRTWQRRPLPEITDLVGVRATDAVSAVVTAADGRVFTTKDAGLTWDRAPLQESPAAPF